MEISELIKVDNWVVIGDVSNTSKYAYKIINKFREKGYVVSGVHPKGGNEVYKSLKEVQYKINAIDLCINPKLGLEYLKEAKSLGIENILIQPGAQSEEILRYCKENNINAIENCALVQLRNL
ncbi:CoA-binding protein [Clostridium nigeriense]|uniref:CoA-binding protein n=1 Tax=Clostridium nigeriense TaxID=1805470 RepID=UPI003D331D28